MLWLIVLLAQVPIIVTVAKILSFPRMEFVLLVVLPAVPAKMSTHARLVSIQNVWSVILNNAQNALEDTVWTMKENAVHVLRVVLPAVKM